VAADSVDVQFGAGKGSMRVNDLSVGDYGSIPNGLFHFASPVPATCSFEIEWSGPVTDRSHVSDPTVGFAGEFVLSQANMTWSAATHGLNGGFSFVSNPAHTVSAFAQLGQMRNGVFFEG